MSSMMPMCWMRCGRRASHYVKIGLAVHPFCGVCDQSSARRSEVSRQGSREDNTNADHKTEARPNP